MIKDIMNKNESVTVNGREIEALKEYFPACFHDGEFDLDRFKEYLGDQLVVRNEGYELKFLGKNYGRLLASMDTTTVVVPDEEHNSRSENKNSQNIYISGDNLDGLKHLLKSYAQSVQCIYIDPPYNTGSDGFVYNDSFNFTVDELTEKLSIDEVQAKRILDLAKRGSASHSAWLMFMYPRLLLARDLLSDDGVIFISIDDNEQANLKLLCDDVFGEENYVGTLPRITKKSGKDHTNGVASNHDYVLAYLKDATRSQLGGLDTNINDYTERDEFYEERGPYKLNQTLDYDSLWYNPAMDFGIELGDETFYPGGDEYLHNQRHEGHHNAKDWVWRWSKAKFDFGYKNGFIVIKQGKDRKRIYTKTYYKATIKKLGSNYIIAKVDREKKLSSIEFVDNKYSNDNATKEIARLINKNLFDFPKPTSLIKGLLDLLADDITVLDFFSGSGTTADAVMQANLDGGTRRHIQIQISEKCKVNLDGYKTIDQIGMERIIRAAKKIKEENPDTTADLGFRHYTLKEPSADTLDKLDWFDPDRLIVDNNLLEEFGTPTVLITWLVRDGYGLNCEVQEVDFAGYKGFWRDKHLYLLDKDLTNEVVAAILDKFETDGSFNPENVVLFGYSFTWSAVEALKTNLMRLKDTEKNLRINFEVRF